MEKMQISLILPNPVSNNVYYKKYNNVMILSREGLAFKNEVWYTYQHLRHKLNLNYTVELEIFYHPRLTANGKSSKIVMDLDNILKCCLDSLQGIIYVNDKQVKRISVEYAEARLGGGLTVNVKFGDNYGYTRTTQEI